MPRPKDGDLNVADWTDYLGELVAQAKAASDSQDDKEMDAVCALLREFDAKSPSGTAALSEVALGLVTDLYINEITARTAAIASRDQDYQQLKELIEAAGK